MKSEILAIALALASVITLATSPVVSAQIATQLPTMPLIPPVEKHLPVETVQDQNHIVTTVTKNGESPTGPIIILPPPSGTGENGTILTPGENATNEAPGNITIISPGGNVTEIPGNITNIGNDTIIIAPPDRNITETPGNVTIIDPPRPAQLPVLPSANCTCNQAPAQPIPPVVVTPAPGQNITNGSQQQPSQQPPQAQQLPVFPNSGGNNTNQSAGTATPPRIQQLPTLPTGTNNQTSNTGSNETQTNPANNSTNSTTPVSTIAISPFLPGYHINSISYKYDGVNNQYLNR